VGMFDAFGTVSFDHIDGQSGMLVCRFGNSSFDM